MKAILMIFFVKAVNQIPEHVEIDCFSSALLSARFFATPNSSSKLDLKSTDDEFSIAKICEDDNDDYELYPWF